MSDMETRDGRWAIRRQETKDERSIRRQETKNERYGDKRRKIGDTETKDGS